MRTIVGATRTPAIFAGKKGGTRLSFVLGRDSIMKRCLYVYQMQNGFFQVLTMIGNRLLNAGPLLVDVEELYQFATDNDYTDICLIAGIYHIGGVE